MEYVYCSKCLKAEKSTIIQYGDSKYLFRVLLPEKWITVQETIKDHVVVSFICDNCQK